MQRPKGSLPPVTPSQLLVFYEFHPYLSWQSPLPPPRFHTHHGSQGKAFGVDFPGLEKGKLFCNDSSRFLGGSHE